MNLPASLKNRVKTNVLLKSRTSFGIGGYARYWYEPRDAGELVLFLKACDIGLPVFVIGCGSNLLVKEGLINKIFIHLGSFAFSGIRIRGNKVIAGAGVKIKRLISVLKLKNLAGYEFLAGIPGTIGGAVVMNAGAKNDAVDMLYTEMKDIVREVEVLDRNGRLMKLKPTEIGFSYRASCLKSFIVLSCVLELKKGDKKLAVEKISRIMKYRRDCQDWHYPSAGSFFKNPHTGEPAGRLIDLCRLKGFRIGGAKVSDKHANFIINAGNAKSSDVIKIMEIIKQKVYNRFKIELTPEVEIVS